VIKENKQYFHVTSQKRYDSCTLSIR